MGEYLRYVISHELAHALGYPHNQRGNTAYDVEDLRDPEFTREFGNSASIVGRTRFNYVAQPEDGDVRVHRSVGERSEERRVGKECRRRGWTSEQMRNEKKCVKS